MSLGVFALLGLTNHSAVSPLDALSHVFHLPYVTPSAPPWTHTPPSHAGVSPLRSSSLKGGSDHPLFSANAPLGGHSVEAPLGNFQNRGSFGENENRSKMRLEGRDAEHGNIREMDKEGQRTKGFGKAGPKGAWEGDRGGGAAPGGRGYGAAPGGRGYTVYMRPRYGEAVFALIRHFSWSKVHYVYSSEQGNVLWMSSYDYGLCGMKYCVI